MERYDIHPICACVPDMQADEYALLRDDIQRCGRIREPLVLFEGKILDGRHRYRVHQETELPFTTAKFDTAVEGDPVEFVNARTIRRSMSASQRAVMTVKLNAFREERVRPSGNIDSQSALNVPALACAGSRRQFKPGAIRTPTARPDRSRRGLPDMPPMTFPGVFDPRPKRFW
jgi:hypothetical protein